MTVETLTTDEIVLTTCPVFVEYDSCGQPLELVATLSVVGDDYGSWPVSSVGFRCGHTVEQMHESLRHADEV